MTLVTLSAPYGAGGSEIGPAVAERFGVPFVDRAIPSFGQIGPALSGTAPPAGTVLNPDAYCQATEQVLRERAAGEGAVILGRAGAVVLRDHPDALHVRLTGPRDARIEQGMLLEGVDRATAERHVEETDRAREAYVRHFYRVDARDPALYHLVIDSTALPLSACADLIVEAAEARSG